METKIKETLVKIPGLIKTYLVEAKIKNDKALLLLTLGYLAVLIVGHWRLSPGWEIIFFLAGGLLGVYFLALAENIFSSSLKMSEVAAESPFRNVLLQVIFVPLVLFVMTSSGSLFGTGLVLSIFLNMLYGQWREYRQNGNIQSWLWVVKTPIEVKTQQIYLFIMATVFILFSFLFV